MAPLCADSKFSARRARGVSDTVRTLGGSEYDNSSVTRLHKNTCLCYLSTAFLRSVVRWSRKCFILVTDNCTVSYLMQRHSIVRIFFEEEFLCRS
jgi:hypothetical protein